MNVHQPAHERGMVGSGCEGPLTVRVSAGRHSGAVWWSHTLLSYSACVDVFDLGDPERFDSQVEQAAEAGLGVLGAKNNWPTSWEWLVTSERPVCGATSPHMSSPPWLVLGTEPGQYLTVDSLSHELARRQLPLDPESWGNLLALRQEVAARWGDVVISGRSSGEIDSPLKRIRCVDPAAYQPVRLEIWAESGSRFLVCPPVVDVSAGVFPSLGLRSNLHAAQAIVAMVWGSSTEHAESIVWELAFEVLGGRSSFALVASSVADWILSADGLRRVPVSDGDDPSAGAREETAQGGFLQLELDW